MVIRFISCLDSCFFRVVQAQTYLDWYFHVALLIYPAVSLSQRVSHFDITTSNILSFVKQLCSEKHCIMEHTKTATIKLPLNLHVLYKALRQKTNSLATWLILNGGSEDEADVGHEGEHECKVADLLSFADNALGRGRHIPERICEALVFVIIARTEISLWYKTFVEVIRRGRETKAMTTSRSCEFFIPSSSHRCPLADFYPTTLLISVQAS